jgi:hypothetical protein
MPLEEEKKEEQKEKKRFPTMRTYETDSAQYIKEKEVSLIDVYTKQEKARRIEDREPPKRYVILIIVILSLSFVALGMGWFFLHKRPSGPPPPPSLAQPILNGDETEEIVIDLNIEIDQFPDIEKVLHNLPNYVDTKGKFTYLQIITQKDNVKKLITFQQFFKTIGIEPRVDIADSLDGKFELAKFQKPDNNWPVLIFKIKSYENAFASMMSWEKKIGLDFGKIFKLEGVPEQGDTSFYDKELENKDVRIMNDLSENPILIYSFINQKYLIITTGEDALKEIFRRFSLPQYFNG